MQRLPCEQLQPGMVVARPVETSAGIVIVPRATRLTEPLIAAIRARAVSVVYVEGQGRREGQTQEAQIAAVARRCRLVHHHPLHQRIMEIVGQSIRRAGGQAG